MHKQKHLAPFASQRDVIQCKVNYVFVPEGGAECFCFPAATCFPSSSFVL